MKVVQTCALPIYRVTAVNAKAVKGNKNVTSIKIGNGVTKLGDSAFENCTKLKSITIGGGLSSIGKNTFKGCKNLKKIQIKSKRLKSVGKNAFKNIHKKCKIRTAEDQGHEGADRRHLPGDGGGDAGVLFSSGKQRRL